MLIFTGPPIGVKPRIEPDHKFMNNSEHILPHYGPGYSQNKTDFMARPAAKLGMYNNASNAAAAAGV